jgi:hypothetical protein
MPQKRYHGALACVLLVTACLAVGCGAGSGSSDPKSADTAPRTTQPDARSSERVIRAYLAALKQSDGEAACALMTHSLSRWYAHVPFVGMDCATSVIFDLKPSAVAEIARFGKPTRVGPLVGIQTVFDSQPVRSDHPEYVFFWLTREAGGIRIARDGATPSLFSGSYGYERQLPPAQPPAVADTEFSTPPRPAGCRGARKYAEAIAADDVKVAYDFKTGNHQTGSMPWLDIQRIAVIGRSRCLAITLGAPLQPDTEILVSSDRLGTVFDLVTGPYHFSWEVGTGAVGAHWGQGGSTVFLQNVGPLHVPLVPIRDLDICVSSTRSSDPSFLPLAIIGDAIPYSSAPCG